MAKADSLLETASPSIMTSKTSKSYTSITKDVSSDFIDAVGPRSGIRSSKLLSKKSETELKGRFMKMFLAWKVREYVLNEYLLFGLLFHV